MSTSISGKDPEKQDIQAYYIALGIREDSLARSLCSFGYRFASDVPIRVTRWQIRVDEVKIGTVLFEQEGAFERFSADSSSCR